MQKKLLSILFLLILVLSSCTGCVPGVTPEPDEPDPQPNPDPPTPNRVVMVELFVAPACIRCPQAKAAIAQLLGEYGLDKIVVLEEYAWNFPLSTGWATSETSSRYEWYTSELGTPDAYFNGFNQAVHPDDANYYKYKTMINKELAKPVQVAISASTSMDNTTYSIEINGNIDNIGFEILNNLVIGAMVYEDSVPLGSSIANHVVRDIITSEEIVSFSPNEEPHTFSLTSDTLNNVQNMNNIHVVVYVQAPKTYKKEILQALYVE